MHIIVYPHEIIHDDDKTDKRYMNITYIYIYICIYIYIGKII